MSVKSIIISGLKWSSTDVELDPTAGFNVLIGPNGSGKTSLLICINQVFNILNTGHYSLNHPSRENWYRWSTVKIKFDYELIQSGNDKIDTIMDDSNTIEVELKCEAGIVYINSIATKMHNYIAVQKPVLIDKTYLAKMQGLQTRLKQIENENPKANFKSRQDHKTATDELAKAEAKYKMPVMSAVDEGLDLTREDIGNILEYVKIPPCKMISFGERPTRSVDALLLQASMSKNNRDTSEHNRIEKELSNLLESEVEIFDVNDPKCLINGISHKSISTGTEIAFKYYAFIEDSQKNCLVLWDEPENGLHPTRRHILMDLMKKDSRTFIIATHATEFCDIFEEENEILRFESTYENDSDNPMITTTRVKSRESAFTVAEKLGIQPSKCLFTSDAVLWVEGPTEILFWTNLLEEYAPSLRAGFDYTLLMYGGSNLSHHALEEEVDTEEFVDMLSISKRAAILCDSDFTEPSDPSSQTASLKKTPRYLLECVEILNKKRKGASFFHYTKGREVENYFSTSIIEEALINLTPTSYQKKVKESLDSIQIEIAQYDRVHDKIQEYYQSNNLKVKKGKDDVLIGRSKWGSKVTLMREMLEVYSEKEEKLQYGFVKDLKNLIEWIKMND